MMQYSNQSMDNRPGDFVFFRAASKTKLLLKFETENKKKVGDEDGEITLLSSNNAAPSFKFLLHTNLASSHLGKQAMKRVKMCANSACRVWNNGVDYCYAPYSSHLLPSFIMHFVLRKLTAAMGMMKTSASWCRPSSHDAISHCSDVWNWSRTLRIGPASAVIFPHDEHEIQQLLRRTDVRRVRMIGSRFSYGPLLNMGEARGDGTYTSTPDGCFLMELSHLSGLLSSTQNTATFAAGTTLEEVFQTLKRMCRMLPCSPGVIARQTLAGAIATGTHGQGLRQSTLSDAVTRFRVVLATSGRTVTFTRDNPMFGAMQLSLGALGAVVEVTLETTPFRILSCKKCATDTASLVEGFAAWNEGYEFCKAWWFPETDRVHCWLAGDATEEERRLYNQSGGELLEVSSTEKDESLNETIDRHLGYLRLDTHDEKEAGDQFKTLTRFRDFTDVIGDIYQIFCKGIPVPQINLEVAVPFEHVQRVLLKLHAWYLANQPHMHYPIILRCSGPSTAWLSPAYGRSVCYFGFVVYYSADGSVSDEGVKFLGDVQRLLAEEEGRPHWGKYFEEREHLYEWQQLYPRWNDFKAVRARLDPEGKFMNPFLERLFAD